jgi:hypothetical protein
MSLFDSIKNSLSNKFREKSERKKQEQEILRRMRLEADEYRRQKFEEHFKENAFKVAEEQAKREAEKASGIKKLIAQERLMNLQSNQGQPQGALSKLSAYTQRNRFRREMNMKKTKERSQMAKRMRDKDMMDRQIKRIENIGKITWH